MVQARPVFHLSDELRVRLKEMLLCISASSLAARMWRDFMTEADRRRLRNELDRDGRKPEIDDCDFGHVPTVESELKDGLPGSILHRCYNRWGAVGIWMRLKKLTKPLAIVDLAYEHGFLTEPDQRRLRRSLGEKLTEFRSSSLLRWDRESGSLSFSGRTVKKVRSLSVAKNVVLVLDAFQQTGWSDKIASPFEAKDQVLHDTVQSLNAKTKKIAFHACDDGCGISCSRR
jgi:hypothetical protein